MSDRFSMPDQVGRACLAAATTVWIGVLIAPRFGALLVLVGILMGGGVLRRSAAGIVLTIGLIIGFGAAGVNATRSQPVTMIDGPISVIGRALSDPIGGRFVLDPEAIRVGGVWRAWSGPVLLVTASSGSPRVVAGESVEVAGRLSGAEGRLRGFRFQGRVQARVIEMVGNDVPPITAVANRLRDRVEAGLSGWDGNPGAALVSGFLIGDTRRLADVDYDVLRRAGLTHFVAVSGSNVVLFLGLWWMVLGPLGGGPRRRAVFGLVGLAVFVVLTRWEPSVLRASVMAGVLLVSRAVGIPLSGWSALGISVVGLLAWSPDLAGSAGFQLSVAATLGVMASTRLLTGLRPAWLGSGLSVTLGAQLAVAPLLLWHFGTIPVLSPLANVVAAPVVAMATITGGIGVLAGIGFATRLAVGFASLVLAVAHLAAGWPQVGVVGFLVMLACLAALRYRFARPTIALAVVIYLVVTVASGGHPDGPAVVFVDVGQGDAILVFGATGEVVLIDGGPDAPTLAAGLRRYGVRHLDLVVLTHPHADHLAGFLGALDRVEIAMFWHPGSPDAGAQFLDLEQRLESRGVPMVVPRPNDRFRLGDIDIEVLGPLRRYDNVNDQSIVLRMVVQGTSILLPGDAEALAQRELGPVTADLLKVPHHGSATNDPDWLVAVHASAVVFTVGENSFGHPDPAIVETLTATGALIHRTDFDGDVVIRLPILESRP